MKKILSFLVMVGLVLAFSLSSVSAEVKDINPTPDEGIFTKMQRGAGSSVITPDTEKWTGLGTHYCVNLIDSMRTVNGIPVTVYVYKDIGENNLVFRPYLRLAGQLVSAGELVNFWGKTITYQNGSYSCRLYGDVYYGGIGSDYALKCSLNSDSANYYVWVDGKWNP